MEYTVPSERNRTEKSDFGGLLMSGTRVESGLSAGAADLHRAITSLQEELEAVDYYNQRAENTKDLDLRDLLLHNRNEEIEHAAMLTEWIRRQVPEMDAELRTYLFTERPVTNLEEAVAAEPAAPSVPGLSVGSLKR
jgi:ferritin-like protein